jgi:5-methylthioadenosine/S-adenosylhomocysteine deaminase
MVDLLIDRGVVITMDRDRRIINDGAVAVVGDRIVAVGPAQQVREASGPAKHTIDATGKVVLPGLIDAHAHAGHALTRGLGAGDPETWMEACDAIYARGSDPTFWEAEAALASLERLKCGVTTAAVILGGGDNIHRTDDPVYGERHIAAVLRAGVREVLAVGPCRPPFPRSFSDWRSGAEVRSGISFERQMEVSRALIGAHQGTARIRFAVVCPVHDPELASDVSILPLAQGQTEQARTLSRDLGVPFVQDGHRCGTVAFAHQQFDLLGDDCLFAHCVDLTEEDIRLIAEHGVKVAHNPSAIMSIRGRCPAPEMIARGITVALGSDAAAPDRGYDMFRHMAQCLHYHRRHFRDPKVLPPGKVLEMATIDAAEALGLSDEIGSLENGKKADIVLVDMFKPHLFPSDMPVFRLAHYANGADVDTVIVDGRMLMEGRRVRSVEEAEVLLEADRAYRMALERTGLQALREMPVALFRATHL